MAVQSLTMIRLDNMLAQHYLSHPTHRNILRVGLLATSLISLSCDIADLAIGIFASCTTLLSNTYSSLKSRQLRSGVLFLERLQSYFFKIIDPSLLILHTTELLNGIPADLKIKSYELIGDRLIILSTKELYVYNLKTRKIEKQIPIKNIFLTKQPSYAVLEDRLFVLTDNNSLDVHNLSGQKQYSINNASSFSIQEGFLYVRYLENNNLSIFSLEGRLMKTIENVKKYALSAERLFFQTSDCFLRVFGSSFKKEVYDFVVQDKTLITAEKEGEKLVFAIYETGNTRFKKQYKIPRASSHKPLSLLGSCLVSSGMLSDNVYALEDGNSITFLRKARGTAPLITHASAVEDFIILARKDRLTVHHKESLDKPTISEYRCQKHCTYQDKIIYLSDHTIKIKALATGETILNLNEVSSFELCDNILIIERGTILELYNLNTMRYIKTVDSKVSLVNRPLYRINDGILTIIASGYIQKILLRNINMED
jgi:hypothetical protein